MPFLNDALPPELPDPIVETCVRGALAEDLGRAGDITSLATIPPDAQATMAIQARAPGILSGLSLAKKAFSCMGEGIRFSALKQDGDHLTSGDRVAIITGRARDMLSAERVALNYVCHLSGIATATARLVEAVSHTSAKICCTRKTTPGLRALEKYAVRCGGGSSHRYGLDDAILIKDNHIAVCGHIRDAICAARNYAGHLVRIEVEVDTLSQLKEALAAAPDVVLLDNMTLQNLEQAVGLVASANHQPKIEASGGITLDTAAAIAETGVDYLSTGWITHSAPVLDLGLDTVIS